MIAHFLIRYGEDPIEVTMEADDIEATGDYLFARKNERMVGGVRQEDCIAFWLDMKSRQTLI